MNLKKRNLEPIFSVKKKPISESTRTRKFYKSSINDGEKENNQIEEKETNDRYINNINVIDYIANSKLKDL